jgi:hypothetical protein
VLLNQHALRGSASVGEEHKPAGQRQYTKNDGYDRMSNDEQLAFVVMAHHVLCVFDHDVPKRQCSEQHRNTACEAQLGVHLILGGALL